ncbi:SagB/ThcOx family dehydrogenase [Alkalihalobacillus sp. NPDC078783]
MFENNNLWNLTGERSKLRKIYHLNSQVNEHFHSTLIKPIKGQKKWLPKESKHLHISNPKTEFEQLLVSRRSKRKVSGKPITIEFLSKLLLYCAGVTNKEKGLFSYPSPGATYPTSIFIKIKGHKFIYRYNPYEHNLEEYTDDLNNGSDEIMSDKSLVGFPVKLFLASDYQLIDERYGEASYRLTCLEMGHIGQNIMLYSHENGYHSVCLGGYNELAFKSRIGDEYDLLYVIVVG